MKDRLATRVAEALRTQITDGQIAPGDRLPSEARLADIHGVSRTVIREAVASLAFEGLLQTRKGSGIFALTPPPAPLLQMDMRKVSSVIELLELRRAVEVESAALAAQRRSPRQEEQIVAAHNAVLDCLETGAPTRDADFDFHVAVAEATNNPRFTEFLTLVRTGIIPRGELQTGRDNVRPQDYNRHLADEHGAICRAILDGDDAAARQAMQAHLLGSVTRYRALLRQDQHTGS